MFRAYGFDTVLAGFTAPGPGRPGSGDRRFVEDYGSVYFTGGDQALITGALAPFGKETRVLKAIRKMQRKGSLVAGSSAGAAIMSEVMFSGGTSLESATYGVVKDADQPGMLLAPGSDSSWGSSTSISSAAGSADGRGMQVGRSAASVLDENTARCSSRAEVRVIGEYGVFVFDLEAAKVDVDRRLIENIVFSYADHGDSCDLETGEVLPGPDKRPVTPRDITYNAPARSLRNVFGAYIALRSRGAAGTGRP